MNIYLNKNCNGFKWFMLENVEDYKSPTLMKSPNPDDGYHSLGNIMMWEEFSLILVHEGESYLLSIDGLEENGLDIYGRPVNMKIIFIDNNYNKIARILLAYAGYKSAFDEWMNKVFGRDPKGVCCNASLLNKVLECIYSAKVLREFRCVKNNKLMFVDTCIKDPVKFAEHFELDPTNVKEVFKKCSQTIMGKTIMTTNPFEDKTDNDGTIHKTPDEPSDEIKGGDTKALESSQKDIIPHVSSENRMDNDFQELEKEIDNIKKEYRNNSRSIQSVEKEVMEMKVRFCRLLYIISFVAVALVIAVVLLYLKN